MRECPKNREGSGYLDNKSQFSSIAAPDKSAPREATSGTCGGANCLYAITSRQEQDNSPDFVMSMIKFITFGVYSLLYQ